MRVVDRVGLSISAGETLALVGESGCGKSMTALAIMRLVPKPGRIEPGSRIHFEGRDLLSLPVPEMRAVRGARIGMIFQEPMTSLNPVTTVGDQVMEAIEPARRHVPRARRAGACSSCSALVGIPDPKSRFAAYPHQLSGGLKQRVMIAMAMAMRPRLLIADEPTTALDATIRAQILELLRDLSAKTGTAVLLITHDFGVVNEVADRVAVMYAGQIVEEGTRVELLGAPRHPYTQGLLRSIPKPEARGHAARGDQGRGAAARALAVGLPLPHALPASRSRPAPSRSRRARPCRRRRPPAATWSSQGGAAMTVLSADALLEIRGLRTWFPIRSGVLQRVTGHVRAVDGVDLTIFPGETLALVGESGCGKTTVGRAILQLVEPTGGNIWFRGADLTALSRAMPSTPTGARSRSSCRIRAPRSTRASPCATAIAEGMDAFAIGAGYEERTERVAELMRKVSLDPETMWRYPHEFSGGQRQRICIARALAVDPALLICDEATSALDVSIQAQILNLLADLQAERKLTYLFITHDLGMVRYFATRVAVMYLGRIVETGPTERIFTEPRHPYTKALLASIPSLDPGAPQHPAGGAGRRALARAPAARLPLPSAMLGAARELRRDDPPVVAFADGICRCVLARTERAMANTG